MLNKTSKQYKSYDKIEKYKTAAGMITQSSVKIQLECADFDKIKKYADAFAAEYIPDRPDKQGSELRSCLSEVTADGYSFNEQALYDMSDTVIAVYDEIGGVSSALIKYLNEAALERGADTVIFENPLARCMSEHIVFPELSLAVCTSSKLHRINRPSKSINSARFVDTDALKRHKQLLRFNRKIINELINRPASI